MIRLVAIGMTCVAFAASGCASGDEEAPTTTTSTTAGSTAQPESVAQPPVKRTGGLQPGPEPPEDPEQAQPVAAEVEKQPSEGDFLAAADTICADLNAAAGDPPTATMAQIELAARDSQELVATGLERLRALEPAPGLEVIFGQFTDAVADQQEIVGELAAAAAVGDVARVQAIALEVDAASVRKNQIATAAGLEECSSMR